MSCVFDRLARYEAGRLVLAAFGTLGILLATGCGGTGGVSVAPASTTSTSSGPGTPAAGNLSAGQMNTTLPASVSPGSITPSAMPLAVAPATMNAGRSTQSRTAAGALMTQLPGAATSVITSELDGTLWALGTTPAGTNKYIYHYTGGQWVNVPGLASSIAVDKSGNLYAVNQATGGVYQYANLAWTALGGGTEYVTVAEDGTPYVLASNGAVRGNYPIWAYAGGAWTQKPGAGVQIEGSTDAKTYSVGGGSIAPDGFYLVSATGGLYYYSPSNGYVELPGAASAVAPESGGVFALAYPASPAGESVYTYSYASQSWSARGLSGVMGIAANAATLFAVTASDSVEAVSQSQSVAFTVHVAPGAITANPMINTSEVNIYVMGQEVVNGTVPQPPVWEVMTNANGTLEPFPTGGAPVPAIPFYGGETTSGDVSQTISLPPLNSTRIYISNGPLKITVPSGPAPWANDGSQNTHFDFAEYSWVPPANPMYVDTTQVDGIGLALEMNLVGENNQTTGFKAGSVEAIGNGIAALGEPWSTLDSQLPYRVLSPGPVQYVPFGNPSLAGFNPGNFNDEHLLAAWNSYAAPNWMTLTDVNGELPSGTVLYGQVDANGDFNFYESESTSGTLVATIPSPFNSAYQSESTWGTATQSTLLQNGPYLLPTTLTANGNHYQWPQNAVYPHAAGTIGNKVSTALNRGVFGFTTQEECNEAQFYPKAPYEDQYAAVVHAVANNPTYGYGKAYAMPYDDQCDISTTIIDAAPATLTLTINPS